ncbi:MAG: DUF3014 domain-containing protein [Lautropia sp.]
MARPKGPPRTSDGPSMALIAVLAFVIALAIWWWQSGMLPFWEDLFGDATPPRSERREPAPLRPPVVEPVSTAPAPATQAMAGAAPAPEYPMPVLPASDAPSAAPERPLPQVDRSDPVVLESLLSSFPGAAMARVLNMQDFVRRLVVTVDNLPRELVPSQLSVAQRVPGLMAVERRQDSITLSPDNFARYDGVVGFIASLDPATLVKVYLKFYPLLDKEYKQLGYPQARFHDRVIVAIDDMLAAPSPTGPIELVQPKVLFRFADPGLQNLSAGQKILIRVGPAHADRIKQVLRRLRSHLLGQTALN